MRFVALSILALGVSTHAEACLDYSQIQIRGTLSSQTFPGPPNFESVSAGDAKETYFFISLPHPTCVTKGNAASHLEPAVKRIRNIQLIFEWQTPKASYDALRTHLGKGVECSGRLLGAHTGHHHSDVMLTEAQCHAT